MGNSVKNKKIIYMILIVFFLVLVFLFIESKFKHKDSIETEGIDIEYRVYTIDGVSEWYKNGEETDNKKSILAVEIKIDTKKNGHIIYNVSGNNDSFDDNDLYDSSIAGNKKDKIYGIKIGLTDDLAKEYEIYYRTYNKKDGWLDYTSDYNISGDNGVDIEKIQIKLLEKDTEFKESTKKHSIGF